MIKLYCVGLSGAVAFIQVDREGGEVVFYVGDGFKLKYCVEEYPQISLKQPVKSMLEKTAKNNFSYLTADFKHTLL